MAVFAGSNIVNDGLVFHFDLENGVKSWKGKPTSNLAVGKFFSGNGNFTTNETIQDELPDGSIGPVRYLNADYVNDPNRTVSIGNYSLTAGETYTLSFYVKNINCTGFGGNLYSPGLGRVIGGIVYPTIYTDRWTRVIKTFTVPDEGVDPVSVSPQAFRDGGYGFFKMCWLQMEQGDVATKYINGVRLDTATIIDLSPTKSTITAANLTYRQDDTPTFDGTDDKLSAPHTTLGHPITSYTSEAWIKAESVQSNLYPRIWDKTTILVHLSQTSPFTVAQNTQTSTGLRQITVGSAFNHSTWTHMATSYDGQIGKIYVNGNLLLSQNFGSILNPILSTSNLGIGGIVTNTSRQFNGEIDQVRLYWDRVLSDSEVKQNFEATRSRYGI